MRTACWPLMLPVKPEIKDQGWRSVLIHHLPLQPLHPTCSLTSRLDHEWPRSARATNRAACSLFSSSVLFPFLSMSFALSFNLHFLPSFLHLLSTSFHLFHSCYCVSLPCLLHLPCHFLSFSIPSHLFHSHPLLSLCAESHPPSRLFSSTSVTLLTSQHLSNPIIALFSFHLIFHGLHRLTGLLPQLLTIPPPCAIISVHVLILISENASSSFSISLVLLYLFLLISTNSLEDG